MAINPGDSGTATTRIAYKGFDRTVTDPDGKTTTEKRDYLGRIQSIRDADDTTTTYAYNGAGEMTRTRDDQGNTIDMSRNTLGHMTVLDDPDLGRWNFTYQANGEVKTRKDQQGQTITYWYNDRNQITSKSYTGESPEEPDVSYVYDSAAKGKGRLFRVTRENVSTTYNAYDDMGRVTRKTVTIDGVEYAFTYAYDDAGNLTRIEHPDGYAVNYSYHNNSNLIATVWADGPYVEVDISDYNNFGKPGRIAYPAFDTLIDYYPRTGRVKGIDVPGLMSLDYQYSDAGDVLSIHDAVRNFAYTYTYDNLHRLKTESASGPFRLAESRDIRLYYEGTETHAVSRVVTHRGERNLIYEDNGNMTIGYDFSRPGGFPERRIDYNAENMPLSIDYEPEGGPVSTVNLTYDGDGRRVKKQAGANTVIYVDNTYEIRNGQPVKYIFAGNMRVAKVTGGMVHYYHKDHLGSSAIVTDTSGAMMESLVYEAYGRPRPTCAPNSGDMAYTYTDQEWDGETGLYNYDARLYDPVLGRFISADSVIPNYYDPQAFDRFAYARNNPLKYIDPDGHSFLYMRSVGNFYADRLDPVNDNRPVGHKGVYRDPNSGAIVGETGLVQPLIQPEDAVPGAIVAKTVVKGVLKKGTQKLAARFSKDAPKYAVDDFAKASNRTSQKQFRHIAGRKEYRGGGFLDSVDDAQKVLDAFQSGSTKILGRSKQGFPIVRYKGVTGTNVNVSAGYPNQATNVFMIKGTKSPSVVPMNPNWKP